MLRELMQAPGQVLAAVERAARIPLLGSAYVQGVETIGERFTYEPWADAMQSDTSTVTRDQAEGLPGVGRGVELVSGVASMLRPLALRRSDTTEITEPQYPTPPLLMDPDPGGDLEGPSWWAAAVSELMWFGNAFAFKSYGEPRNWAYPDWPARLTMLKTTGVVWDPKLRRYQLELDGPTFDAGEIWHAKTRPRPAKRMGRGILDVYQDTLKVIRATEKSQFVLMTHGVPTGIINLSSPTTTPDEAAEFKRRFLESQRTRSVAVLNNASWENVQWNPDELSMIPTREFNLRLASDLTGVPPYMLGVPAESRVYSNNETEWTNFLRSTLAPLLAPLEDQLSRCLPHTLQARFDLRELKRADTATRWGVHKTAYEIGAVTVDEIRNEEAYGPLPDERVK